MARRGPSQSQLRVAASQLASDEELCHIFAITPEMLAKHRELIEQARARAFTSLRFARAKSQARRVKRSQPAAGGGASSSNDQVKAIDS